MSLKTKITKILATALLMTTPVFHAQAKEISAEEREKLNQMMDIKSPEEIDYRREPTQFDLGQMELALRQKKYDAFFEAVMQVKATKEVHNFLNDRTKSGHIPVYWVLADINSRQKKGQEAHKWLYIATIMTEQDIAICNDKLVEGNTKRILKYFPDALYYTRSTPQYIKPAMTETYNFVVAIKERQSPSWVCDMKSDSGKRSRARMHSKTKWDAIRLAVLEKYAGQYKPKMTSKDVFRELDERDKKDRRDRETREREQKEKALNKLNQ